MTKTVVGVLSSKIPAWYKYVKGYKPRDIMIIAKFKNRDDCIHKNSILLSVFRNDPGKARRAKRIRRDGNQ